MNAIIIGKKIPTVTTISIYPISNKLSISANPNIYRVSLKFLEIDLEIEKEHSVGKKLTELIEKKVKWYDIEEYLLTIALTKIDVKYFKILIENKTNNAYENGKDDKAKEFKKVIGIL